jgi:hypothetical protein
MTAAYTAAHADRRYDCTRPSGVEVPQPVGDRLEALQDEVDDVVPAPAPRPACAPHLASLTSVVLGLDGAWDAAVEILEIVEEMPLDESG